MRRAKILRVFFGRAQKNGDPAIVILVDIGEADALAVGSKGKVIIRHQQFAVRRAILAIIQLDLIAEGQRQVIENGFLADQADDSHLFRRFERLFERLLFRLLERFRSLFRGAHADDISHRSVQLRIDALFGETVVHDHAVPVSLLVLRESAPRTRRFMSRAKILRVFFSRAQKNGDLAVIVLVDIGEANALAVGSESEVVIRHQQFAVRRAVRTIIQLDFVAEGSRKVLDDGLLADQADYARLFRRFERLFEGLLFGLFLYDLGSRFLHCCRFFVYNELDRAIEKSVVLRFGKGVVRHGAVPIFHFILGEGAVLDLGMLGKLCVHEAFIQFDQRYDAAVVRLVYVYETNALTRGRESKVIIRQQEIAAGSAIRSADKLKLVAVFARSIRHLDALVQSTIAVGIRFLSLFEICFFDGLRFLRRGDDDGRGSGSRLKLLDALFEVLVLVLESAVLLFRPSELLLQLFIVGEYLLSVFHNHVFRGLDLFRFESCILLLQRGDLLVLFAEFLAVFAVFRILDSLSLLGEYRQTEDGESTERQHHAEDHVNGDQYAGACRYQISYHNALIHDPHPPQRCRSPPRLPAAFHPSSAFSAISP